MTDRIALGLAALVTGAVLLDLLFNGGAACFFLVLKLADLIHFVAFWRH